MSDLTITNLSIVKGIARGCGWQKLGAVVNLGSYYLVGVPLSVVLAFVLHMKGKVKFHFLLNSIFMFSSRFFN